MSDPFLAQILIVPYNFAPFGWAFCDGQILPISQNTALFSLLGTNFGGNGTSNFALPNLQNATPMGAGNGPGLTPRVIGESDGTFTVTLIAGNTPPHTHQMVGDGSVSGSGAPTATDVFGVTKGAKPGAVNVYGAANNLVALAPNALGPAGGNLPHNNRQPYLGMSFVIAMQGIFPARN